MGKGDSATLMDGSREYKETSFSIAIFIQPASCLSELIQFGVGDNGLFDPILFFIEKTKHYTSKESEVAVTKLKKSFQKQSLVDVFKILYHLCQLCDF